MSIFPEFDMFRRNIGDLFVEFERVVAPGTMFPYITDLDAQPLLTSGQAEAGRQGEKGGDVEMKRGEGEQGGGQLTTQQPGALGLFTGHLRAPVQIKLDVSETDKEIDIKAEIPGVPKDKIKVSVQDRVLKIEAEKQEEKKEEGKDKKVLRQERVYGKAVRTIRLPKYADDSKMTAKAENGVLHITVPKKPEQKKEEKTVNVE